jgi:MSHA pilin protein MshC
MRASLLRDAQGAYGALSPLAYDNRRSFSGFTLVELVTTLVIVGLLTAVSAPRFFDTQPFSARGYADELAGVVRVGREVALASQCPVQIRIDNLGTYSLWQRQVDVANNTCLPTGLWTVPVIGSDGATVRGEAPNGVAVTAVSFSVEGDGSVSPLPPNISVDTFVLTVDDQGHATVTP